MAINTYMTYLMSADSKAGTFTEICPIKDYPDMMGDRNQLDSTTLSDAGYTYIEGIRQTQQMLEFTANYDKTVFNTLSGESGKKWYKVAFGKTGESSDIKYGTDGYFVFEGELDVKVVGKGVDEVREMIIQITPNTAPEFGIQS